MSWKTDNLDRAEALNVQARELRAQVAAGDATDAELARYLNLVDGINRLILLGLTGGKPMEIYGKIYAEHLIEGADRDAMAGIDLEASAEKDVSMVEGQSGKSTQVSKLILSWFSTRPE